MDCCPNCFSHDCLIEFIRSNSTNTGECDYCGATDVQILDVGQLTQYFHNLFSMYVEADTFETARVYLGLFSGAGLYLMKTRYLKKK